jgi:transposase
MNILAIDLGKFNSMFCFFDSTSQSAEFLQAATSRSYFLSVLKNHPVDLVVMEACGPSGWVKDLCEELQIPTLVCSTNEEAWRWKNVKRKTDRDDALKLARLAAMNELKPTHVPSQAMREYRTLVKYRKTIVRRINRIKNSIRSLFANRGIEISRGARTWHTGRKFLHEQRKSLAECAMTELWRGQLDIELAQLEALEAQLETAETRLAEIAKDDPRVQRLQRIPGVGPRTAEVIVTAIDDPHRFKTAGQVSAYAGLVPRQYQSGQTDRRGRITKRGSQLLRTMLVENAWCLLRYNPWARATYTRICGGQKTRRKKAAVALARKLLVIAWAILRDETEWDESKITRTRRRFATQGSKPVPC